MDTISLESYNNSNLITDLDNFRSRYLETDNKTGQSVIYPSSEIYSYEQHLFQLVSESKQMEFKPRWYMRPDYTSYDVYDTVCFWALILFVNNIYSIEDYKDIDSVLIPPVDLIYDIIGTRVPKSEIQHINPFLTVPGIKMFQRKPLDDIDKQRLKSINNMENSEILNDTTAAASTAPIFTEYVDTIILQEKHINDQYVDLKYLPVNASTVTMFIDNFTIPQKYGYDYVLIQNMNLEYKRITWKPSYCYNGRSNLASLLEEDTKLKIKYLIMES